VLLLAGATVVNVGLRFIRWQYFLRRCGIRRPTRSSLWIYLAAFGVSFVPLFAGEIALKGYLIGAGDRRDEHIGWTVGLYERVCDLVALSALAAVAGLSGYGGLGGRLWWAFLVPPGVFVWTSGRRGAVHAAQLLVATVDRMLRARSISEDPVRTMELTTSRRTLVGMGLSLAAWAVVCVAVALVLRRITGVAQWWLAGPLFAAATILGGLSVAPGGAGVTGLVFGYELIRLGAESGAAFALVAGVRAATFWLVLGIGQLALLRMTLPSPDTRPHFEAISAVYDAQLPPHIRELLVDRKTRRMLAALPATHGLRGSDVGCGLGWYMRALRAVGIDVVGLDLSAAQARVAQESGAVVRAAAHELPFRAAAFDFAYAVNVIHHLSFRRQQRQALEEAARVLKPGGVFFLHEINVTNPLFRIYMGYVFPLLKRIDEGTELWIAPARLPAADGLRAEGVSFFTFVPDFVPHRLLRWLLPVEAWLEASRWARYSAHFMATYRKVS